MYDIILESTDPKLVIQQLDTGNLFNGGATALDIVTRFPGRFMSMHVKDELPSSNSKEKYESTLLGTGIAQVKKVIDIGRKSGGTIHFIIEQEAYQSKSPIACAKENLTQMKAWGY
jgi:L-ribulose-5-phosphate 3-epimerase UlaE